MCYENGPFGQRRGGTSRIARLTPIGRAQLELAALGFVHVQKVRTWSAKLRRRQRLLGFADLVGVQTNQVLAVCLSSETWGRAHAERRLLTELPAAQAWLSAGNQLELWSFVKRAGRWRLTRLPVVAKGE